jgi:hypothetical protein
MLGRYLQPVKANNETFDALLFNQANEVVLFQFTVRENHDIKSHGLVDLIITYLPKLTGYASFG